MGRLATAALKGLGVLLLAFIVLSVIATIVGIALSLVATVISIVVTLAVVGAFLLACYGLWSLVRGGDDETVESERTVDERSIDDRDPKEQLQDQYVGGELTDEEFERELDLLLETEETAARLDDLERKRASDHGTDRSRLRDR
ncbi:SHOCT domain-containing protein [Halosolutus gelatinilyticus]|uniref:SHOCT domain-containing protein n=1 Tax=Halosolutus gelatinilyticus TaxID=2931975 RepID=UPI001FF11703|nr:SHOCT domain-containing protein [Halosolutus gelatinilyticus]